MTSVAFILGVVPLAIATGAGALGRHSVGTTIIGGMVVSTVLNLFFIPVLYVLFKSVMEKVRPRKTRAGLPPPEQGTAQPGVAG
jgi:HAE1 family hydrophobic/amphiphilic exporter-1